MGISTHILDTTRGRPAAGVEVTLSRESGGSFCVVGRGVTDADGRARDLLGDEPPVGAYRLTFAVEAYFARSGTEAFYPEVNIDFRVRASSERYHVPLLLNPFGYSTYRGS